MHGGVKFYRGSASAARSECPAASTARQIAPSRNYKARIRELSLTQAQTLAQQALAVGSADDVRALVEAM